MNTENNKLIAEFMGMECVHDYKSSVIDVDGKQRRYDKAYQWHSSYYNEEGLKYHKEWDWLMPVVEKIEDFQDGEIEDAMRCHLFNVTIEQCFVEIINMETSETISEADGDNKMDATYQAVVGFIEWYNEKK
jgi:hypothetical protein